MSHIITYLTGSGIVNDTDASMLITQGFGNWGGSEYVVTEGFSWFCIAEGLDLNVGDWRLHYQVTCMMPHYQT